MRPAHTARRRRNATAPRWTSSAPTSTIPSPACGGVRPSCSTLRGARRRPRRVRPAPLRRRLAPPYRRRRRPAAGRCPLPLLLSPCIRVPDAMAVWMDAPKQPWLGGPACRGMHARQHAVCGHGLENVWKMVRVLCMCCGWSAEATAQPAEAAASTAASVLPGTAAGPRGCSPGHGSFMVQQRHAFWPVVIKCNQVCRKKVAEWQRGRLHAGAAR